MRSAIVRAAALCLLLGLAACQTELYAGLPEQEANEMIALLMQRDIAAVKVVAKDGSDTIMVDKSRFAEAVTVLHDNGYPRKTFETMGDVFKSGGLVASPMQERARFLYALGQELSGTISQIDGVLSARVEVVLPENDILDRSPTPSSASVFVRYQSDSNVDRLVPQIKMLVADSVQGLSYDKVSVVLVPAVRPPPAAPTPSRGVSAFTVVFAGIAGALMATLIGVCGYLTRRSWSPLLRGRSLLARRPETAVRSIETLPGGFR